MAVADGALLPLEILYDIYAWTRTTTTTTSILLALRPVASVQWKQQKQQPRVVQSGTDRLDNEAEQQTDRGRPPL